MKRNPVLDQEAKAHLRRQAEQHVIAQTPANPASPRTEEQRLIHELQVHQIELEMQNEDLRTTLSFTPPDDRQACTEHLLCFQSGKEKEFTLEKRFLRPDGSIHWASP